MLDELYSRKTSRRAIFSWQTQFAGAAHGILPCRPPLKPSSREATGRLLQRVEWRSRDRRMLDEHWSFPRTGTELPSEAEGKDPREETSAVPACWAR
jgi:hypothetical protein